MLEVCARRAWNYLQSSKVTVNDVTIIELLLIRVKATTSFLFEIKYIYYVIEIQWYRRSTKKFGKAVVSRTNIESDKYRIIYSSFYLEVTLSD
jgi:hypothetical protein